MLALVELNSGVDFAPESEYAEILQNVRTIVITPKGSVPLDRDFGVSWDYVDKPQQVAQAMMIGEIITAIKKYEPRAVISSIEFESSIDGVLRPKIALQIGGEE